MYVDDLHKPLFDWIHEEEPEPKDDEVSIEDVESILAEGVKGEHEEDEEFIYLKRNL